MKAKDIVSKFDDDDCRVCRIHEEAYNKEDFKTECAWCGSHLKYDVHDILTVVGETNGYDPEQEIYKAPVSKCSCGEYSALLPHKIQYNGNHDIFYTGGKDYLLDDFNVEDAIHDSLKQYTERILAGEELSLWNIKYWINNDIEHMISEYLYKKGLKK